MANQTPVTAQPIEAERQSPAVRLTYVLVTPARNEAAFLEQTIQSVIAQQVRPLKWIIVSDGSTDGTDDIVRKYAAQYDWIQLVRTPERTERHFAGKVHAFNAGYAQVQGMDYDVLASLDADITFDSEYFSFLLSKLEADSHLGLVGTPFNDNGRVYDYRYVSIEHVSGACQVFRRECFEAIGGYVAVKGGSIDHIAVISSRMHGWKTRTFTEKVCFHHRALGTAEAGTLKSRYKYGVKDYVIGNHPLWQVFRTLYQMRQKPYVLGGISMGIGYIAAALRGVDRPVSGEFVAFHRSEQMLRLKMLFKRCVSSSSERSESIS